MRDTFTSTLDGAAAAAALDAEPIDTPDAEPECVRCFSDPCCCYPRHLVRDAKGWIIGTAFHAGDVF